MRVVRNEKTVRQLVSGLLIVALSVATAPFSFADVKKLTLLGTVTTTAGAIQLRGVPVAVEGTLFSGDRISSCSKASARVTLAQGPQLVLGPNTDLTVEKNGSSLKIVVRAGYV